ncbi:hypothetical protein B0T16DRAFT_213277 [Cercophora newfieldiana]|uniref:F-box domain-containing protein n=1 Tax=Cercophora newfieldiana TaxID=92897 RepID=A0AA39XYD5_9PEZI|nr:hypothetical protein B0T16DRAFT_213277 [Cercophora newfieldiana]
MQAIVPPPQPQHIGTGLFPAAATMTYQETMKLGDVLAAAMGQNHSRPAAPSRHPQDGADRKVANPLTKPQTSLSPLESLPFDVFLAVLSHPDLNFDYATVRNLRNANSRFYKSVEPDALCPRDTKADFYQIVEGYNQHKDHLVCFRCWKFKGREAFPESQRKGKRGKGSSHVRKQRERWCWECGPGEERKVGLRGVRRGRGRVYWCEQCEEWKPRETRCAVMPWGIVCGDLIRLQTRTSRLEQLPDGVFDRVLGLLGYRDRVFLAATNKGIRKRVGDPAVGGPILERFEFVASVAKRVARENGRLLACYGCWRFKDQNKFSEIQRQLTDLDKSWFFHRRCCACLQLFYGRGSGTEEGKSALLRFKKQGVCYRCKKMRFWDEECEGCAIRDAEVARLARLGALKKQEREQRREVEPVDVLEAEDPGVVDWLDTVGLADPWPWAHSRVPPPVEEVVEVPVVEEDESWDCNLYSLLDDGDDWLVPPEILEWMKTGPGQLCDVEEEAGEEGTVAGGTAEVLSVDEPLPSQTASDAPSVRRGFEVWLVYSRFLGRTHSDASAVMIPPTTNPGSGSGSDESSSTLPPPITTIEAENPELHLQRDVEEATHLRHRTRFLQGEMTVAEQSLYLRIQAFVDRQRHRRGSGGEQQQGRSSRILELVSERLRALGSKMAGRRGDVVV